MNHNLKLYILIFAIILAVAIPPIACYLCIVVPREKASSRNTNTQSPNTPDAPDGSESPNGSKTESSDPSENSDSGGRSGGGTSFVIVIDPGHGGYDPGKVSPDGIAEKDINLAISLKLEAALSANGFSVYLTRSDDSALGKQSGSGRKSSDLRTRIDIADKKNADLFISIHQNSYSAPDVHGAQVFYYSTSKEGKSLAECIQEHLISDVDPSNHRSAKGNSEYMVLTENHCTALIVECGFLSNADECASLTNDGYQSDIADSICSAVTEWVNSSASR